ncbi:MAG TPA: cytochrome c-type biogenesis protein CcmH [Solirubrobacteraceae bacterium]|nr:cytochrome c-type biogenesis protein CcmH [Solirubrobacteraceae bacterium]
MSRTRARSDTHRRTGTTRRVAQLALLMASIVLALVPSAWATTKPRASLTDIENDVMCTACHEPLAVANSPEAQSERNYIRGLIAQGLTKPQIERNLVAQYGEAVLGKPPASGVNLTIYILPPALLAVGIAILAVTLPRWRRRTRAAASEPGETPARPLNPADAERLEQELSHFRG